MKWSEQAWRSIEDCYHKVLQMDFIIELGNGNLPKEKFCFYLSQDSFYLEAFSRVLSLISARAKRLDEMLEYGKFAQTALLVERTLHESYFAAFNVTDRGNMQPACHHYAHFLKSTAAMEEVEIAMAAVLPCFWMYQQVGMHIYSNATKGHNPYQKWIDTYVSETFAFAVKQAIDCCDRAALDAAPPVREKMIQAFVTAAHMEYKFWSAAYELQTWE